MSDISVPVGKVAGLVVRPAIAMVRRQLGRRGAETLAAANPATVAAELAEAFSVLRRKGETPFSGAWAWMKSHMSARPTIFDDVEAQDWLAREDVQSVLSRAAIDLAANLDLAGHEAEARRLYGVSSEEPDWYGAPLFDFAVAFLALSLKERASFDQRFSLTVDNARSAAQDEKLSDMAADIKESKGLLADIASAGQAPAELVDRYIEQEVALDLGERAFSGDLRAASPAVKIQLFRYVAAIMAREPDSDPDAADIWLARARDHGANDLSADLSRIALARNDPGGALQLLQGRQDPLAVSLQMEAIGRRDGNAAGIDYFETYHQPADVTGYFLSTLAHWLAGEGRLAAGEAVLDLASEAQLAENRTLRFVRMRMRLAACSPPDLQAALLDNHAALPPARQLRDDAEGLRLRALALDDARQLEADLRADAPDDFFQLAEMSRLFLTLSSEDAEVAAAGKAELEVRLADPARRVLFAPLAKPFEVAFDQQALARQLEQAERLNGLDGAELRAALALAVHGGDADQLVRFLEKHGIGAANAVYMVPHSIFKPMLGML